MERLFTNKKIWKMLIVAILVIMAVQIIAPSTVVYADPDDAAQPGDNVLWLGVLMRPIASFLVSVCDGTMSLLHSQIMGQESCLQAIGMNETASLFWSIIGGIVIGIIVLTVLSLGAAWLASFVATANLTVAGGTASLFTQAVAAAGFIPKALGSGALALSVGTGLWAGFVIHDSQMADTLYLPTYSYSAEEIFKGNIRLFNVDFFNTDSSVSDVMVCWSKYDVEIPKTKTTTVEGGGANHETEVPLTNSEIKALQDNANLIEQDPLTIDAFKEEIKKYNSDQYVINYYFYTKDGFVDEDNNLIRIRTSPQDSAEFLRKTISKWYVAIRNICIVGMLSILVYIGIRMMLTSVANDKAKYKEMLKDWVVGLCLLFVMHYIMAFSVTIVGKITDIVKTSTDKNIYVAFLADKNEKISEALQNDEDLKELVQDGYLNYPTNLMGFLRLKLQEIDTNHTGTYIGYVLCFMVLVIFTVMFTFTYLRRLLYMAFLTLIAPMVALTYPIDKINDGQAQGFNTWLKEYIFNLLIQPMHLLLYFILITSAINLAETNVIYSLVAIGFMLPAEKLLRGMFGFEKAKTPPLLGGPAGTALLMQGINGLSRIARGGRGSHDSVRGNAADSNGNSEKTRLPSMNNIMDVFNNDDGGDTPGSEPRTNIPPEEDTPTETSSDTSSIVTPDNGELIISERRPGEQTAILGSDGNPLRFSPEPVGIDVVNTPEEEPEGINVVETPEEEANDTASGTEIGERSEQTQTPESMGNNTRTQQTRPTPNGAGSTRPTPQTNSGNNNTSNEAPKGSRFWRSVGAGASSKGRSMLRSIPKTAAGMVLRGAVGTVKRIPGAAVGIATGATTAMIGGAAAIASGDPKKMVTAMGTAAGVGYSAGSRITSTMTTTNLDSDTRRAIEVAKQTYNDPAYEQQDREAAYKKASKEDVNRVKARQVLGSTEAVDEFMGNNGNMQRWMHEGETDFDDMLAMQQLVKKDGRTPEQARATMGMLRRAGNKDPLHGMGDKEYGDLHKTLVHGITRAGETNEDEADRKAKNAENYMSILYGYRYNK